MHQDDNPHSHVPSDSADSPRILPRSEHPISRSSFAPEALTVLQRLKSQGFKPYLVGGAVRDLYLGRSPKDYDIATDARPSRLKKLFRNCRIIGRRFRIAHVFFPSGRIIEVATFRCNSEKNLRGESGIILRDNEYGTPGEDARRRDLTINGLFYDLETFSIIDYVGGVNDLEDRVVRMINDPGKSFVEDPVRMIRALRHAARTGFRIDEETREAIHQHAPEIVQTNPSRLMEEFFKDLRSGAAQPAFRGLVEMGLFESIFPLLSRQLQERGDSHPLWSRLAALDEFVESGKTYNNSVLLSLLLQTRIFPEPGYWHGGSNNPPNVWGYVSRGFHELPKTIRISRRDTESVTQILISYRKLEQYMERGKMPGSFLQKNYMKDALDFFRLDRQARGESVQEIEEWQERWKQYARSNNAESETNDLDGEAPRKRRRRRRRRAPRPT